MQATVFIDANILKFSATELVRYRPRHEIIKWGPTTIDLVVHDEVIVNPNEGITNPELSREASVLSNVANLGKAGLVEFVQTVETQFEIWGLPSLDSESGQFYGASIRLLKDIPFKYERVLLGAEVDGKEEQLRFLLSIKDPRFEAFQRACGAFQGPNQPPNRNQLLDSFHIWCAEIAGCSYFLTLDFKLQKALANSRLKTKLLVVRPSELLRAIDGTQAA